MKIRDATDLGKAVRLFRAAQNITQLQLALTAGTNRRFIIDLERGKPTCQIGKVMSVLATLGLSVDVASAPESETPTPREQHAR